MLAKLLNIRIGKLFLVVLVTSCARSMRHVSGLIATLAFCTIISANTAAVQFARTPPQRSQLEKLNQEAQASDSAGVHEYSQHLIVILLREDAGAAYEDSLTDRLAKAELMARSGKRKLISEETIARAFNDLMKNIGAPESLRGDDRAVEKARSAFAEEMPAVVSEKKNGTKCYPGEAIWVLTMLIENVGANPPHAKQPGPYVSGYVPPARQSLTRFFTSSTHGEVMRMLGDLANDLGI